MKRTGNTISNQAFNPRNTKPNLPLDADEIDMTMEKFIRQKYQTRSLSTSAVRPLGRTDTGSTGSSDDRPPQVPAKDSPRSNGSLRASFSPYPASRIDRPLPPIVESRGPGRPIVEEKLGSDHFNEALGRLRSMGFANEKRNTAVLKGVNNDMTRAVQTLLRLGEGGHASETLKFQEIASQTSGSQTSAQSSQTRQNTGSSSQVQALPYQNTFHSQQTASPVDTWNQFNATKQQYPPQPTPPTEASFQNLSLANQGFQSQSTGSSQNQPQNNPFLKAFTPPISPAPYQQPYSATPPPLQHQHPQFQADEQNTNPFLRHSRSQNFMTSNDPDSAYQSTIYVQPTSTNMPTVPPYAQQQYRSFSQPQLMQSQITGSAYPQPHQQQQLYSQSALYSPPVQNPLSSNTQSASDVPFQTMPNPQQNQQYQNAQQPQQFDQNGQSQQYSTSYYQGPMQQQNQYQTQNIPQQPPQLQPQQTGRHTKSSILALYDAPSTTSITNAQQPHQLQQPQRSASMPLPNGAYPPDPNQIQQFSNSDGNSNGNGIPNPISSPTSQSRNPFCSIGIAGRSNGLGHIREESREFTALNGRHSPDAFAGLSARLR